MDIKEDRIRKPNPAIRKDIFMATFKKIKSFLEEQTNPIYKSEIIRHCKVDPNSLNLALTMIKFKAEIDGRISIIKSERGKK